MEQLHFKTKLENLIRAHECIDLKLITDLKKEIEYSKKYI